MQVAGLIDQATIINEISQIRCQAHISEISFICLHKDCLRSVNQFLCLECYENHTQTHRPYPTNQIFSRQLVNDIDNYVSQVRSYLNEKQLEQIAQIDEVFLRIENQMLIKLHAFQDNIKSKLRTCDPVREFNELKDKISLAYDNLTIKSINPNEFIAIYSDIHQKFKTYKQNKEAVENANQDQHNRLVTQIGSEIDKLVENTNKMINGLDVNAYSFAKLDGTGLIKSSETESTSNENQSSTR